MEKPAGSPRRAASTRALLAMQPLQHGEDSGSNPTAPPADASETAPSGSSSSSTGTGACGPSSGPSASPRIDRGVRTRTHDRITLQLSAGSETDAAGCTGAGDRGWWSPHGEPYRPLGNPELSLKLSPRLPADSPSRSKTFQDSNPKDGSGQREPSQVSATVSPATQPDGNVLDMFPRNLRKRPAEDRQARLAVRLQESIAQYSPGKVRGLRRTNPITITRASDGGDGLNGDQDGDDEDVHTTLLRLQHQHNQHQHQCYNNGSDASSPSQSPRYHVEHGDTSVYMLREAVHDGVSRLRLARNGQYFLDAVASGEALDLAALKRHYDEAREKFLVDQETRKKLGPAMRLSGKAGGIHDDSDDGDDTNAGSHSDDHSHHKQHSHGQSVSPKDQERVYLPYTSRQPQTSPHKPLPTLAEFKTKIREERMPQRMLLSSRASMATMGSPPSSSLGSPRKSSARQSLMGSFLVASGGSGSSSSPEKLASIPQASSPRLTRIQTRRGSVVLLGPTGSSETRTAVLGDANSDALARVVSQVSNAPTSPRVHSVVRLQNTVDAMENVKHKQSETLAKTLTLLNHDRRDCLSVKFRNLHIDSRAETDISEMRVAAEADRVFSVQLNMAKFQWYPDLLRHMLANRESPLLHPAELFCVDVIRHVASEGHAFQSEQLYKLVLLLHPEDVSVSEVQQLLTFLRRALLIPVADWEAFFRSHGLPEPVEIFKQNEAKLKDKKRQLRIAKLRTVITLNSVLRRMTTPTTPSSD